MSGPHNLAGLSDAERAVLRKCFEHHKTECDYWTSDAAEIVAIRSLERRGLLLAPAEPFDIETEGPLRCSYKGPEEWQ